MNKKTSFGYEIIGPDNHDDITIMFKTSDSSYDQIYHNKKDIEILASMFGCRLVEKETENKE